MSGTSQHLRMPAMLAVLVAIVGLVVASAAAAPAAVSAAKPFQLVLNEQYEPDVEGVMTLAGAFTSKAPFCESGSAVYVDLGVRRFACADGSGSITLDIGYPQASFDGDPHWSILEGTSQYAGLRGRGTWRGEEIWPCSDWDDDRCWTGGSFRTTFQGVVADDAVAPTIGLASATASKVEGKKSVYTISAALDLRDNVEDNPVSYTVSVRRESGAGPWLASKSGEATGGISFEFRVRRPNAGVRAVLIRMTAVDPVGNESSLDARVELPR